MARTLVTLEYQSGVELVTPLKDIKNSRGVEMRDPLKWMAALDDRNGDPLNLYTLSGVEMLTLLKYFLELESKAVDPLENTCLESK